MKTDTAEVVEEMRGEYTFDYSRAKPNRFAEYLTAETLTIVLDPDVAAVFQTSDDVNRVLRSLIETMPHPVEA